MRRKLQRVLRPHSGALARLFRTSERLGERGSEKMSCGNSGRSDDEDQRQTYYAISNYTAVEDSQVLL